MQKKSILIIYTGGTIGMVKTPQGYQPIPGLLKKHMAQMPECKHPAMPRYDLLEYAELLDSADTSPKDWNTIAHDIASRYEQYDAFLVLHGTDTMAYTASALSFLFENLSKPIIFTGSQVPLVEAHTDARENLINAMLIAGNYAVPEVCVFFNNILLRGNRTRKTNAYGFDAFSSPNFPTLGEVGITISIKSDLLLQPNPTLTMHSQPVKKQKIAKFSFFPGADLDLLATLIEQPLQALILETYGVGNAPVKQAPLLKLLESAYKKDIILLNATQCLKGSVDMQSYATGQALAERGVMSCYDMTPESIIAKLYYLLSLSSLDTVTRKAQFQTSLRGEVSIT
ncbi:MAG: asparaginase [Gammaproteobacteria bacterium]|nr:asparaginase [Gammaproteobacteria bacterium]